MALVKKTCFDTFYGGPTVHLEPRKGDRRAARDYCVKESSRWTSEAFPRGAQFEMGFFVRDGERSDLYSLKEDIKAGKTDEYLLERHTSNFARYGRFVDRARAIFRESRIGKYRPVDVWWIWGEPGTGKSALGRDWLERKAGAVHRVTQEDNRGSGGVWWTGYDGQKGLLIDDLNPDADNKIWLSQDSLLTILDHYAFRGQSKGGHVVLDFSHIVVTSNDHPKAMGIKNYPALSRRIKRITKLLLDESIGAARDPMEDEHKVTDLMSLSP